MAANRTSTWQKLVTGGRSTGNSSRAVLAVILILCMLAQVPVWAFAEESSLGTENLIRSAMVFNFCKFVEWPSAGEDQIVLGIISKPGETPDFSSIAGKMIQDTRIEVRPIYTKEDLDGCQLVFIDKDQENKLSDLLKIADQKSILTISEMDDFCSRGGIIQLVERRGKLRFFINRKAAGQAQLNLSSQLLKMAKIVEGS